MTGPLAKPFSGQVGWIGPILLLAGPFFTPAFAQPPWTTLGYLEKVRSQFLSLRHTHGSSNFSIDEQAENLPISGGFSRATTVLEMPSCISTVSETAFFSKPSYFVILV